VPIDAKTTKVKTMLLQASKGSRYQEEEEEEEEEDQEDFPETKDRRDSDASYAPTNEEETSDSDAEENSQSQYRRVDDESDSHDSLMERLKGKRQVKKTPKKTRIPSPPLPQRALNERLFRMKPMLRK